MKRRDKLIIGIVLIGASFVGLGAAGGFDIPVLQWMWKHAPVWHWIGHDRTRPLPPAVDPGYPGTPDHPGKPPSDAIVLFNGKDLSQWVSMDGSPAKWRIRNGVLECVPGAGSIRTLRCFGYCQLHLEFATPYPPKGEGQGRGNSGVFFGMGRYEIQILDSYQNKTYADGMCGAIYNQYPPLVNACRPPGQWQTYDIIWTPPKFDQNGNLISPAVVTAFQNGILIHHNAVLIGGTDWLDRPAYKPHPEKLPISLQDHGNPIRFRNIWVRELGPPSRPEYYLPDALLKRYAGRYRYRKNSTCTFTKQDGNLILHYGGHDFVMFADSTNHFFCKTIDIQAEFKTEKGQQVVYISVGDDRDAVRAVKVP